MTSNDLNAPVRRNSALTRVSGFVSDPLSLASGMFAGAVAVLFLWLAVTDDPLGGEPVAVLPIDTQKVADAGDQDGNRDMRDDVNPADGRNAPDADPLSQPDTGPEPLDMQFDQQRETINTAARPLPTAPIEALVERSVHGLLPQISADGKTPADQYARPLTPHQTDPETAKIAIMVGGMGLSSTGTSVAINRLPAEVTLAFAPYAKGLQDWVHKARQNGHEVMLQLPMEPYDYPDNDPGPHTLLSSLPPPDNIRRLEWLMARFTGYFGVTNYMGAKFTSSADAVRPVLRQINRRGLVYMEDGSSARSGSAKIARQIGLKAASADLIIDATANAAGIDAALTRLETIALERGFAVGVGSGLPITMERLVRWAEKLHAKGIVLVPVSATIALRQNTS